jgi:hypothetical protein
MTMGNAKDLIESVEGGKNPTNVVNEATQLDEAKASQKIYTYTVKVAATHTDEGGVKEVPFPKKWDERGLKSKIENAINSAVDGALDEVPDEVVDKALTGLYVETVGKSSLR